MEADKHSSHFLQPERVTSLQLQAACRPINLLLMMLVVEIIAVMLSFLRAKHFDFFSSLAFLSVYFQLVLFLAVGLCCHLSSWMARRHVATTTIIVLLTTSISALLVAWILREWLLQHYSSFAVFTGQSQFICLGLVLFLLRHQFLQQQRYQQLSAQINARLQALQAYIRPHFLFNSLNNLAAIISVDAVKAEKLVLAMAQMLRYVMRRQSVARLGEEIDFVRQYVFIEQSRLGERLRLSWDIPDSIDDSIVIPTMILQPLVENAINHGPAALIDGGIVEIELRLGKNSIDLRIRNHAPRNQIDDSEHLHIAINNIRARLQLLYDAQARFVTRAEQAIDDQRVWWLSEISLPRDIANLVDGKTPPQAFDQALSPDEFPDARE